MPLTVTLLGFENEQVASWAIPDDHYPLYLLMPKMRRMTAFKPSDDPAELTLDYMEFRHDGPLLGTYRRIK